MDAKFKQNKSKAIKKLHLTEGSTKADNPVSPFINAKRKDTAADAINILTSKSSNCFSTNLQKGVPGKKMDTHEKVLPRVIYPFFNKIRTAITNWQWKH